MRPFNSLAILSASAIALTLAAAASAQSDDATSQANESETSSSATSSTKSSGSGSSGSGLSITFGSSSSATAPTQDTGTSDNNDNDQTEPKKEKLRWRGTALTLDQSFTTQTVGVGEDYRSDNPFYEMALIFRPRYYLLDGDTHSIYATVRFDLSREFTNADSTTEAQETRFGNIPLDFVYGAKLYTDGDVATALRVNARFVFPTSKYTYRGGNRLRIGGGLGLTQAFPLAGSDSTWFPTASLRSNLTYMKHINVSTTSTNDNFGRERQDAAGHTFVSKQFSSAAKVSHELTPLIGASVDFTDSLHLSVDYTWILHWTYKFGEAETGTTGGTIKADRINDPTNYRVTPYFMAGLDYDLLPEVGLGVGYYNQSGQIGPNGERRSPFWSPDAAFFIDITANLDEIYTTAAGKRSDKAASRAAARQQARANNLRNAW